MLKFVTGLTLATLLAFTGTVVLADSGDLSSLELGRHLHSLQILAGGSIILGTHGASAISSDGGRHFATVAALADFDAMEIAADAQSKMVIVAGHQGARISRDAGQSWQEFGELLPAHDIHALGIDPASPAHIIAYIDNVGIFETNDGGQAWRRLGDPPSGAMLMGDILIRGKALLIPIMPWGLLRSADGGSSWSKVEPDVSGMDLIADPSKPSHLYLSGPQGFFTSHDGGTSWSRQPLPGGRGGVVAPAPGGALYLARFHERHARLWKSTDAGKTWQPVVPS
ncbi:MAG: hypothetical protein KGM44_02340 [bacterium]|nr:hypothetical protein [bacterium]